MAASTGPILAAGGITMFNAIVVHDRSILQERRAIVGALIAAGGLALWEKAMPRTAVALSWLVLLSVLLVRVDPTTPSPIESFQTWYNTK